MSAADTAKILEQFMDLVSKEIDEFATRVRSEPAAQATVVELLHGLSAAAQKSKSDFSQAIRSLPKKDREEVLSNLEKSGVVNAANLLIPLLKTGHLKFSCLQKHEAAKVLYAIANVLSWWGGYYDRTPAGHTLVLLASIAEALAVAADIAAQICDEAAAELLEQKIDYIMDLPDGAPVPTVPPGTQPVSLTALEKMLEVCKKFYKFEGFFTPSFRKDKQLIRIGPLPPPPLPIPPIPILVTGFIDLGGMQDYDVVTITTKVLEPTPAPRYVIWRVKTFTGRQSSGMKHFQDFADLLEVPGDGVEVLIAQSASSHNFDPNFLLTIPYQFLVESTIVPQFVLS